MRKLLAGSSACLVLVCSLIAGTTVAGSVPTAMAPDCAIPTLVSSRMSPATAVLGPDEERLVTQTARVRSTCVEGMRADLLTPTFGNTIDLRRHPGAGSQAVWSAQVRISSADLANADAGTWRTRLRGQGAQEFRGTGEGVRVLRAARFDTRLVTRSDGGGARVTLRGRLARANWNTGRYEGYSSRTVDLQRRTTTGEFRRVRAVTTDEQGVAQAQIGGDDGCFRFAFRGSGTTAGVHGDLVCARVT